MTDDRAGGRRLQPGHWLLIGIVVLLVAAGVAIVVRRGDGSPTVTEPTGTPSTAPSTSATPRPDCSPEITSTWADATTAKYGFVYRSQCDQVVRELRFRVTAVDPAGEEIPAEQEIAYGGVLFPGSELAAAGGLHVARDQKIGSLEVQVINFGAYPPENFSGWAQTEVVDLTRSKPGTLGMYDVSGTIQAKPSSVPVCISQFVLIMRDNNDKIVYADVDPTSGETLLKPSFPVSSLPGIDFGRTKIYAPQTPRTEQAPSPGMPCNGS
ncbi:MAG TPA: hypothetical protein VGQ92_28120 [Actinoplanes sp.]|jgi:hypothetical protein|nr:hypothetical protein [Actinoplanes sp.]